MISVVLSAGYAQLGALSVPVAPRLSVRCVLGSDFTGHGVATRY